MLSIKRNKINNVQIQTNIFLLKTNLQKHLWKGVKSTVFAQEKFLIT